MEKCFFCKKEFLASDYSENTISDFIYENSINKAHISCLESFPERIQKRFAENFEEVLIEDIPILKSEYEVIKKLEIQLGKHLSLLKMPLRVHPNPNYPPFITELKNGFVAQQSQIIALNLRHNSNFNLDLLLDLPKLKFLHVSACKLIYLSENLGLLTELENLDFGQNELQDLPESFSNFQYLTFLNLGYNKFSVFPKIINTLHNLEILYLMSNQISNVNISPEGSTNLKIIYLSYNYIQFIPSNIFSLRNLNGLYIDHNKITSINFEAKNSNIFYLDLSYNNLTEIDSSLRCLKELRELYLSHNKLSSFPIAIRELKNIDILRLDHNNITTIPDWISECSNLQILKINDNRISELPERIGDLKITHLDLENNTLLKSLPLSFKNLKNLYDLNLKGIPFLKSKSQHYGNQKIISQFLNDL